MSIVILSLNVGCIFRPTALTKKVMLYSLKIKAL